MAAFVKQRDSNHLLTVGVIGFFGASTPALLNTNPSDINVYSSLSYGNVFPVNAICRGEDFARIFSIPDLDFSSLHLYPDFVTLCTKDCRADTADFWVADVQITLTELGKWVLCRCGPRYAALADRASQEASGKELVKPDFTILPERSLGFDPTCITNSAVCC